METNNLFFSQGRVMTGIWVLYQGGADGFQSSQGGDFLGKNFSCGLNSFWLERL